MMVFSLHLQLITYVHITGGLKLLHTLEARRQLTPLKLKTIIEKALDDDKAFDVETIDLSDISSVSDYMIVASGTSNRQVSAMARKLVLRLEKLGMNDVRTEGMTNGDWVVVDAGDVMVHLFRPEVRDYYNIEKMWRTDPLSLVPMTSA